MHPYDIIAALQKAGYSQTRLAEQMGVYKTAINNVIHGRGTSHDIATTIATITKIPMNRMWPDGRYNKPPRPLRRKAA
ncbi:MAG TPA: hypothetical protein ENJ17_01115 [Gammaproteobacteria bacterium]|nr:hypothetical protein [Gammaproteobacteria bacterium]